ncbi:TadE family type IV pilus minor pilin [Bifidobacterium parmae]|uniref:Pilus assembly protein TadE n=1 Tax=Bifidobacterium parmae TaxID=361854 RepID=A0A2N5J3C3_9BIFI|nr:TadE family type IV pilus minor pilin [Bifidobacterium parmae]PLS28722.1 pilus assembly protein TadE [Bifidobacterium parmae]
MTARYSRRRSRRPPPDKAADPGAVTAEFATVLPAVVVLALLLLALSRTVMVSIGCQDAASAAARAAVTAGDAADPAAAAHAVGGGDVAVQVNRDGDHVTVTTRCPVVPDPLGVLPTRVEGRAVGVIA